MVSKHTCEKKRHMKNIYQTLYMVLGGIAIALAVVGTILPIMPTIPFLLLAAACFSRSSPKFHQALMNHTHFGPMIRDFYAGRGLPKRVKRVSLTMILCGGAFSVCIIPLLWGKFIMAALFIAAAVYLFTLNTSDQEEGI